MKVRDLIAKLSELPEADKDRTVWLEGCDCYGEWGGSVSICAAEDGQRMDDFARVGGVTLGRGEA